MALSCIKIQITSCYSVDKTMFKNARKRVIIMNFEAFSRQDITKNHSSKNHQNMLLKAAKWSDYLET